MTFHDQIKTDLAGIVNTGPAAVSITYTPKGGSPVTRNALVFAVDTEQPEDETGQTKVQRRTVVILTDATLGIVAPKIDDLVAYGGVNWRVDSIESEGFGEATLTVIAGGPEVKSHDQHQKKISS